MIEISVFKNGRDWSSNKDCVLRTRIANTGISVPFDNIVSTFKFLYGLDAVIEFVVL